MGRRVKAVLPSRDSSAQVDEYIASYPQPIRDRLQALRQTILQTAPDATETFAYAMPAYRYHGSLVYFAAFRKHIGFYPTASGISHFAQELTLYRFSKGAIQFAHDRPIPLDLVARIVAFRVQENLQKSIDQQ
jgi:uncharacterized protein YdhG (YjbR/CyaY superfamily)